MTNWRVIEERDADGAPFFSIRDVYGQQFVTHSPPYPVGRTRDELKRTLTDMLSALDKPAMIFTRPVLRDKVISDKEHE